jgi:hypothetical protein
MPAQNFTPLPARLRLLCAAAASGTTVTLAALLLGAWHAKTDERWLVATPEILAELQSCDTYARRGDRVRCQQAIVGSRLNGDVRGTRLAAR